MFAWFKSLNFFKSEKEALKEKVVEEVIHL